MLKDIVIQTLMQVQNDCSSLTQHAYPTVHNRGMDNRHLASLVERSLTSVASRYQTSVTTETFEVYPSADNASTPFRRFTTDLGSVWLIPDSLKSANRFHRHNLIKTVSLWKAEFNFAIQPNDCLVLVCDHWLSRISSSQQLLDWWLNRFPDDFSEYAQQGILLSPSETQKLDKLLAPLQLSPCYKSHAHPIKKDGGNTPIKRYVHLYAIYECV
ncbi:hypothetical protein [Vibrio gallicus]|uniref:hypothetical protein n=1 Tax=Vibrio gallicus TaxID=190897 RepID=UPI0021C26F60|nr:hypothetical protein [Vibrio gallicus]